MSNTTEATLSAWRFQIDGPPEPGWVWACFVLGSLYYQGGPAPYLTVETGQGPVRAQLGDWVLRSGAGTLHVCPEDLFSRVFGETLAPPAMPRRGPPTPSWHG